MWCLISIKSSTQKCTKLNHIFLKAFAQSFTANKVLWYDHLDSKNISRSWKKKAEKFCFLNNKIYQLCFIHFCSLAHLLSTANRNCYIAPRKLSYNYNEPLYFITGLVLFKILSFKNQMARLPRINCILSCGVILITGLFWSAAWIYF